MKRPGKMIKEMLESFLKKPATLNYPAEKSPMPKGFRGKLKFTPSSCIGCLMCMKDCPTGAIKINKVGDKRFECEIDLSKCIYCAQCVDSCPKKALSMTDEYELAKLDTKSLKIVYHAEPEKPAEK
ncbi:MAG: 4Fe-4S binding protein [Candidatus Omnitrophota bacterium]|jgi:formate hydrogenlyase subunit 6/NADH:ubiquinone oxidoreductase subunit I